VTAYSGVTGIKLWSVPGTVPEGGDPEQNEIYLARGSTLLQVSPATGRIGAQTPTRNGGMFVVRDGFALGLDLGANGGAWGYDIADGQVALSASAPQGLGWPHYFADLSGVGGSADPDGDLVIIAACAQAGQPVTPGSPSAQGSPGLSGSPGPSTSPTASPTPTPTPTAQAIQPCLQPELVALSL
jgi:hypothetical protein